VGLVVAVVATEVVELETPHLQVQAKETAVEMVETGQLLVVAVELVAVAAVRSAQMLVAMVVAVPQAQ
jgi:hypothetical protein